MSSKVITKEQVMTASMQIGEFQRMFEEVGLYLLDIFGDYKLKKYHKNTNKIILCFFINKINVTFVINIWYNVKKIS